MIPGPSYEPTALNQPGRSHTVTDYCLHSCKKYSMLLPGISQLHGTKYLALTKVGSFDFPFYKKVRFLISHISPRAR